MSVVPTATNAENPYKGGFLDGVSESGAYLRFKVLGDLGVLAVAVFRHAIAPPFRWWRDTVVEISLAFRRTAAPMLLSHAVYSLGFGLILFGDIIQNLGLAERHSGVISIFWLRELATWITGMVFAGIVGSAIAADLGARKIREELDALAVLGVREVSTLVVPRVLACTIAMPALALISVVISISVQLLAGPTYFGMDRAILLDGLRATIVPGDVLLTTGLKNLVLGFFIGLVACYKGLTAAGGADGVGRAVNQTVVITFFGVWFFNSVFNFAYFTAFPDVATFRG